MKRILSLIFTLSMACVATQAQDSTSATKTLPSVLLKDLDGNTVDISDYGKSGKITVISFWATWCGPCKKELKNINEYLEDWTESYNMQLVAISTDDSRNTVKVKPFVNGQAWEFDVLLDVNQDLMRALNAPNVPFTVIIDQKGNIVYTHLGYQEGDEFELEEKLKALNGAH
ncbi:MAG: TlpA family protein disulfide reductase [Bacteroidota bacterium]|nr:TlpA family protein disulfide reductase [Bacteroidota bacterium]MDX5430162.1 TlpA family protein disulfide reductase [Bacteroidota bacterium]MDX5468927.1 TlpA family protein disulfide reductase [Bacteroidota bacterium]